MAKTLVAAAVFSGLASATMLRSKGLVTDSIKVNGDVVAEGDSIMVGCQQAPPKATSITVCGASYKVVANLLTECQAYKGYSETIGHCDSGVSGCDTKTLETGYTDKFKWEATSYEIQHC
eukprot:TRINITY_DN1118_c0_g5_i1.p2 TRINITY_DN1118_c0_g5~~TRINITY_DN1118_c0_g5_i1.p2  ORF type:complete len:140 (-),score=34.58 TRINITY_DN1118_c0_g5_i1:144-503(-)